MRNSLISTSKFARFGRPALAAAVLALAASASYAGAVVNITSFMITTDGIPFVAPKYAVATGASSTLELAATNGGANGSAGNFYAGTWSDGPNTTAQTSAAVATGNVISFTDALTQLQTGGFNLNASAMGYSSGGGLWSMASATGETSGAFSLVDENGDAVAGSLTFDIFYDLTVSTAGNATTSNSSSDASLFFSAFDADGSETLMDMLSTSAMNPDGTTSGQFTLTFQLAAGELVGYSLAGIAAAAAIPEPGSLALAMFGLFAAGATCRKARRQA